MPMAAIKLVSALLLIEMVEPGSEGHRSIGTAHGANYVEDTPAFRRTVAWSYAVTYGTTLAGFILIRLCLGCW
ncbi:unnamed protein product [Cladocopium goreaui]|uniref:Alpha-ketoglutarate-dependent dioxygenase alkB-like 3 n=1 Tax=Cladocopium goreaui TaxID=2562237 RepID=A0A9P1CLS2_9DINO|nr:unnamed protein product [Cladocopium goreaui]